MPFFPKLSVIPRIYQGRFVDIDREIQLAYQKYPFPWPNEKPYDQYSLEDVNTKRRAAEVQFQEFLRACHLSRDYFRGKVVLELGTGVGWDAMAMASCGARHVCAVDNSLTSIQHGQRFAQQLNLGNIEFIQAALYDIGRLDVRLDVIIAKGVLHHVFDLARLAHALRTLCRSGTEVYATHSRFSTRLGFYKYFNNHLAWAIGGNDIEQRIDAGIRLFRPWTRSFTSDVVRDRTNDLAGVFYMARSFRTIRKIFEKEGFTVERMPDGTYLDLYPALARKLEGKIKHAGRRAVQATLFKLLLLIAKSFRTLSAGPSILNRFFGWLFTVFFLMPPYQFRMVCKK